MDQELGEKFARRIQRRKAWMGDISFGVGGGCWWGCGLPVFASAVKSHA